MSQPLTSPSVVKNLPTNPVMWRQLRALWYMGLGRIDDAIRHWVNVLQTESDKIHYREVKKLIQVKAYQEAKDYLDAMVLNHPEELGEIKYFLAQCCLGQGQINQAKEQIEVSLEKEPENARYLNLLGDCLLELGYWRAAAEAFTQSLRSNPQNTEITFRLGTIYARHGEYLEALRCFQGCCQLNPHRADYWEMKGEMQLNLRQIVQACSSFKRAMRFGVNPDIAARLAYCYIQTEQIKKGTHYYELALKYDPDHFDSMTNLAAVYQNQSESLKALSLLERAYNLQSCDPILLNNMAYTLLHLGRSRKAADYYMEALKYAPDHPMILYNLAVCYARKGNWEEGIFTLNALIKNNPEHTDAWVLLGNIYDQTDEPEMAVDCYNRALKLA